MKTKEKKALQEKGEAELRTMLNDAQKQLMGFVLDHSQAKLKNPRSIFHQKKAIAVIHTILKEKEKTK